MSNLDLPSIRIPWTDPATGQINRPWWIFLQQLIAIIGTGNVPDLSTIIALLQQLVIAVDGLERDAGESGVGQFAAQSQSQIEQVAALVASLQDAAPAIGEALRLLDERAAEAAGMVPAHGRWEDPDMHAAATTTLAGFMSAADKTKLDGLASSRFMAYRNNTQAISAATLTTVVFDTELFDDLGEYNPATGVFTAQAAGSYSFSAGVRGTQTTATDRSVALYVNGAERLRMSFLRAERGDTLAHGAVGPVLLAAGDQVVVNYTSGLADTVIASQTNCYFGGWRIK